MRRPIEYWIVDLEGNSVDVYRSPSTGQFRSVERFEPPATLSPPLAFADVHIPITSFLS
jgi:Uma2 family endonuclease